MKRHRHRAARTETWGFSRPVAWPENPAAHGNVVEVAICSCGAERRTNVNQWHVERGAWVEPAPGETPARH